MLKGENYKWLPVCISELKEEGQTWRDNPVIYEVTVKDAEEVKATETVGEYIASYCGDKFGEWFINCSWS